MSAKFLIYILFFTLHIDVVGQNPETDTAQHNLFAKGVYLEDLKVIIPWYADFKDISKYGNPKIDTASNRTFSVQWDSVKILNGISVNLKYSPYKILFGKGGYSKLTSLYGTIIPNRYQDASMIECNFRESN